jgi:hypothetical protein
MTDCPIASNGHHAQCIHEQLALHGVPAPIRRYPVETVRPVPGLVALAGMGHGYRVAP